MSIVVRAAKTLDVNRESMRAGLGCAVEDVDETYTIFQKDWQSFATKVSDALRAVSLSETCGMSIVRFVSATHGLRLEKMSAARFYDTIFFDGHPHVDIVQIHRADTSRPIGDGAMLVRLAPVDFAAAFRECPDYGDGTTKYRMDYLADYGGFSKYGLLRAEEGLVTFCQAYNSAAKMARIGDPGLLPSYVLCNGSSSRDRRASKIGDKARQRLENVIYFTENYVRCGVVLRVEEVVTLDARRHDIPATRYARGIFSPGSNSILLHLLMSNALIHCVNEWSLHVDRHIGEELQLFRGIVSDGGHAREPCASRDLVRRMFRAEYRVCYFNHGHGRQFNYDFVAAMYRGRTELESVRDGIIQLCALDEELASHRRYPFFTGDIPVTWTNVITYIYHSNVPVPISSAARDIVTYVLHLYANWAYSQNFLVPEARSVETADFSADPYTVFQFHAFLQRVAEHRSNDCAVVIQGCLTDQVIISNILHDPRSAFSLVVCTAVNIDDVRDVEMALLDEIRFHVFP